MADDTHSTPHDWQRRLGRIFVLFACMNAGWRSAPHCSACHCSLCKPPGHIHLLPPRHMRVRNLGAHGRGAVTSLAWSRDSRHIVTGSEDKHVVLWSAEDGKQVRAGATRAGGGMGLPAHAWGAALLHAPACMPCSSATPQAGGWALSPFATHVCRSLDRSLDRRTRAPAGAPPPPPPTHLMSDTDPTPFLRRRWRAWRCPPP